MKRLKRGWKTATIAMALAALGVASGGCLGSMLLKKAADMRIVDTGVKNPEGMEIFFRGASRLGCKNEQSSSGDWWTRCKGSTFGLDQEKLEFGFDEGSDTLKVGCDKSERERCDDPINRILDEGRKGA